MECVKVDTLVSGTTVKGAVDDLDLVIQTLEVVDFHMISSTFIVMELCLDS
ncbi:hypothetical protein CRYUN_Cryun35bG0078800 [Craigia yunnanensis]